MASLIGLTRVARAGYRPSEYDGRDVEWPNGGAEQTASDLPRPEHIWDQGPEVDACTGCALATAMEMVALKRGIEQPLSPLFLYYFARSSPRALGTVRLRRALQTAATRGLCRLELHAPPMTIEGAKMRPSPEALLDGRSQTLLGYDPILGRAGYYSVQSGDRVARWRTALTAGSPLVIGLWTQDSYWAGDGMGENQEAKHRGAHAAVVVGHNDALQAFTVRDSRGESFAQRGEWQLSYEVVRGARIAESWAIAVAALR